MQLTDTHCKRARTCALLTGFVQRKPHAPSAYNFFFKETLPKVRTENSTATENMQKVGAMWKSMDKADQEKYIRMAQESKAKMEGKLDGDGPFLTLFFVSLACSPANSRLAVLHYTARTLFFRSNSFLQKCF